MSAYTPRIWLAIAVWVAGAIPVGLAGYAFARSGFFAPLHRFDAPGDSVRERLDGGDERAILVRVREGRPQTDRDPADLRCTVRSDDGTRVRPHDIGGYTVARGTNSYRAELAFTAPRAGRYTTTCDPPGRLSLAVSHRLYLFRLLGLGFAALAVCAATIMVGVRIARRARRPTPP